MKLNIRKSVYLFSKKAIVETYKHSDSKRHLIRTTGRAPVEEANINITAQLFKYNLTGGDTISISIYSQVKLIIPFS